MKFFFGFQGHQSKLQDIDLPYLFSYRQLCSAGYRFHCLPVFLLGIICVCTYTGDLWVLLIKYQTKSFMKELINRHLARSNSHSAQSTGNIVVFEITIFSLWFPNPGGGGSCAMLHGEAAWSISSMLKDTRSREAISIHQGYDH